MANQATAFFRDGRAYPSEAQLDAAMSELAEHLSRGFELADASDRMGVSRGNGLRAAAAVVSAVGGTRMRQGMACGGALRRFASIKPKGNGLRLEAGHHAMREARTIFPTTVNEIGHPRLKRLLKSGHNSRKIGKIVTKGRLRGFPIFTLTLEERATCPRTCQVFDSCYGNRMPYAQRVAHGPEFEERLWNELADKQAAHPTGFLVRLHILGDFYSERYADLWNEALEAFPALNIFGYTARDPRSEIGSKIGEMIAVWPDRFHVRFSGWNGPKNGAVVVDHGEPTPHIVCPAQTGKTDCCATCGLCWHSDRTIAFLRH